MERRLGQPRFPGTAPRGARSGLPLLVAGDPWLYKVARLLLVPAARIYGRFEVVGAGRLPSSGPALVVANHPSDVDPILVALPFPRPLRFMADAVQFDRPFVGWCIRRLGAFPVRRDGFARDALLTALWMLQRGEVVAVFPEGDVHGDGMHEFEAGVAFLAEKSRAPVIPVAVTGAEKLERWWLGVQRGSWRSPATARARPWALAVAWQRRPPVRMVIGAPLCLTAGDHRRNFREASSQLAKVIDRLRAA